MQPVGPLPAIAAASLEGTSAESVAPGAITSSGLVRLLVGALLGVALVRAVLFAVYAAAAVAAPYPFYYAEGANVHLAWRVEHGLPLYPDENAYPFTLNYMGPAYYAAVGLVGRWLHADIPALFVIGRLLTVASGLALAALVYLYLARRLGPIPALTGGLLALGSGPMVGFGVMVRPDAVADVLGLAGFLLAGSTGGLGLCGGAVFLALACLTKQTAGVYVLATVAALLATSPPAKRRAALLVGATVALVLAAAFAARLAGEPRMLAGLLAQGQIGFSGEQLAGIFALLHQRSPELLWFSLLGLGLWLGRRWRNLPLAALAISVLIVGLVTAAKKGSDLNYFLSLRAVAAMGAATLCQAVLLEAVNMRRAAALVLVSLAITVPSSLAMGRAAIDQIESARQLRLPDGQGELAARAEAIRLASDPQHPILTDCDNLAVYQATDVPLLDPYLFRLRVETGRIDPAPLVQRIARRQFAALILSADPAIDYPEPFVWTLPRPVAAAIAAHYRFERHLGPWRVYVPR